MSMMKYSYSVFLLVGQGTASGGGVSSIKGYGVFLGTKVRFSTQQQILAEQSKMVCPSERELGRFLLIVLENRPRKIGEAMFALAHTECAQLIFEYRPLAQMTRSQEGRHSLEIRIASIPKVRRNSPGKKNVKVLDHRPAANEVLQSRHDGQYRFIVARSSAPRSEKG